MALLKVIYKGFYKTRNRKESTKVSFAGMLTYYIMSLVFIVLLMPKKLFDVQINLPNYALKVFLILLFIGGGFLLYRLLLNYANKKLNNDEFYQEIKWSVTACKTFIFLFHFVAPLLIVLLIISIFKNG